MNKKIKDHPDYIRDSRTNAIINTNTDVYNAAKARRRRNNKQKQELNELRQEILELRRRRNNKQKQEINELRQEILELKELIINSNNEG